MGFKDKAAPDVYICEHANDCDELESRCEHQTGHKNWGICEGFYCVYIDKQVSCEKLKAGFKG